MLAVGPARVVRELYSAIRIFINAVQQDCFRLSQIYEGILLVPDMLSCKPDSPSEQFL